MLQQAVNSDINFGPLRVSPLATILNYRNDDVISKFCKEWDVSKEDAEEIFNETLKFMYLASKCQTECINIEVHEHIQVIDEMWHTFILFTDSYHKFCQDNLGGFLHHFPFTKNMLKEEMKHVAKLNSDFLTEKRNLFNQQISKINELLGENTTIKWYAEFATKYSIEQLNILRKPINHSDAMNKKSPLLTTDILQKDKSEILKIIAGSWDHNSGCGCSGKGCGAGCSCNSR
ncbi:glycine-rich domain-containing protein [Vibrio mediterranei]